MHHDQKHTNIFDDGQRAEDILGQYYVAFGQGAGTMRVSRSAIGALRRRYFSPIREIVGQWESLAGSVLPLVAQVGRLASFLATQAGRTAISERDFLRARQVVEASAHQSAGLLSGPACPVIHDEHVQPEPTVAVPSPSSMELPSRNVAIDEDEKAPMWH